MADIFEQFESKPRVARSAGRDGDEENAGDPRAYVAFRSVDRPRVRLKIRPVGFAWERLPNRLPNRLLLRIMENRNAGTDIVLVYSFLGVTIKGRNLQPMADAIEMERCLFIQEFDSRLHDKPADPAAPYIEKITIHAPPPMPGMDSPLEQGEKV